MFSFDVTCQEYIHQQLPVWLVTTSGQASEASKPEEKKPSESEGVCVCVTWRMNIDFSWKETSKSQFTRMDFYDVTITCTENPSLLSHTLSMKSSGWFALYILYSIWEYVWPLCVVLCCVDLLPFLLAEWLMFEVLFWWFRVWSPPPLPVCSPRIAGCGRQ